jgi:hypothetical protein
MKITTNPFDSTSVITRVLKICDLCCAKFNPEHKRALIIPPIKPSDNSGERPSRGMDKLIYGASVFTFRKIIK